MPGPRIARAAAVLALLPLTACGLRGEVTVEPDVLSIDVVVTTPREVNDTGWGPCTTGSLGSEVALKVEPVPPADGSDDVACRLQGDLAHDAVVPWVSLVTSASDGVIFAHVPTGGVLRDVFGTGELADLDLTVHFPGQVVSTNGAVEATGTSVRLADPQAFRDQGFAATARTESTVPVWVLSALAGLGWGAILTGLVGRLRSRVDVPSPGPQDSAPPREEATPEPPAPAPPGAPTVWAPDA